VASAPATFSCPHCSAPLRMRHRPAGTLHLPCPDCGRPLELSDQLGDLLVRPADPKPMAKVPKRAKREAAAAALAVSPRRTWARVTAWGARHAANPLVVTWLAAGAAGILLLAAFLRSERHSAAESRDTVQSPSTGAEHGPSEAKAAVPAAEHPPIVTRAEPQRGDRSKEVGLAPPNRIAVQPPVVAPKPAASPPGDPRDEVVARLAQRILRFEQPTPVPFDALRLQLEDLSGLTIRYDEAAADPKFRQAPIRLALAGVTLASVLDEAAAQAGLTRVVDAAGVMLVPSGEGPAAGSEPVSTATR